MKINTELAGTRSNLLVSEQRTEISSKWVSPCTSETLAWVHNWILGTRLIWSIKYWDMVLERDSPRTKMTTRSAYLAKFMAAWPAEFAPPTPYTISPFQ